MKYGVGMGFSDNVWEERDEYYGNLNDLSAGETVEYVQRNTVVKTFAQAWKALNAILN